MEIAEILKNNGYKYISELGSGGFGQVILAQHHIDNQKYAIKKLFTNDTDQQENIKREICTLATINHQHIINYKTSFIAETSLYLVMEYCPGGSLLDWIESEKEISLDSLLKIFIDLTKTFAMLHKRKIIHHDIKPSNIMFDAYGNAKISDFGCVNTRNGTIIYLPPEEFGDSSFDADPRTDIFALGITLMECILRKHPLIELSFTDRMLKIKNADFPIQNQPYWLQDIILRACHYYSDTRFQSMEDFHRALIEKDIPKIIDDRLIDVEKKANILKSLLSKKRWIRAKKFIDENDAHSDNLNYLIQTGRYYLGIHNVIKAKEKFEQALKINPSASIEKDIAEVYLQLDEPAKATSILSNYINRNFYDLEAHNQLLQAYFISDRWELGYEQAKQVCKIAPNELIFENNLAVFNLLQYGEPFETLGLQRINPFILYNYENVFLQNEPESWRRFEQPKLKSKLLFQEFKFRNIHKSDYSYKNDYKKGKFYTDNELVVTIDNTEYKSREAIITFGREGYSCNTFSQFSGNNVSRRHFVIINQKNNVWLYDLDSTGLYIDDKRVYKKYFLLGLHEVSFGDYKIYIKSDSKLLI